MAGVQDDFRSSVPPGHHVLGEGGSGLLVTSGQTEVTNLEIAVFVEEQVAWLQISVNDVGAVDIEAASEQLVHEVLAVVVSQILSRVNHSVHICLHQVCHDVDILETGWSWRLLDVYESDDVLMVKEFYRCLLERSGLNLLKSLISLTIRLASIRSSNAFGTFLMATLALMLWSKAEHTTPYAPCPICLMYSYLSWTMKVVPKLDVSRPHSLTCTVEACHALWHLGLDLFGNLVFVLLLLLLLLSMRRALSLLGLSVISVLHFGNL